ncbi:MAG: peptide deformylase [Candidatus Shapirobacteria bacterium]
MIRKIITVPDPRLRQKSKPVKKINQKIKNLVNDLIETVRVLKEIKGVGLSAVQVGEAVRVFVVERDKKLAAFINPEITEHSSETLAQRLTEKQRFWEGCLSVPTYYGAVDRPYQIKMRWQDVTGQNHEAVFVNKEAAYLQHEYDHLEGVLFVDRILAQKGKVYKTEKNNQDREEMVEVIID